MSAIATWFATTSFQTFPLSKIIANGNSIAKNNTDSVNLSPNFFSTLFLENLIERKHDKRTFGASAGIWDLWKCLWRVWNWGVCPTSSSQGTDLQNYLLVFSFGKHFRTGEAKFLECRMTQANGRRSTVQHRHSM